MGWLEEKWEYGPNGDRKGPFSKKEIQDLIKRKVIMPETPLSRYIERDDYSAEYDYPAIKTEFSVHFPRGIFIAATKDVRVPDLYMWLGLFSPLFLLTVIYFVGWDPRNIIWGVPLMLIPFLMFNPFLWIVADSNAVKRRGYLLPTRAGIYAMTCFFACIICELYSFFVLSPIVYFYFRNIQLRRSLTPVWMSIACLLLITWMSYAWPRFDKVDPHAVLYFGYESYNDYDY